MKRRLLSLLAIAASIGGSALAAETGDYLYTPIAKFKVTGTNLIANGNFSNLTEGWTNLELLGLTRDLHPLDNARAEHTKKGECIVFRCALLWEW